ncbi:tyrosine-protein kinase-like otk [Amia ocellicauda]|uniref:tyrosine-protein kinase-like otk n=1 Tax=Amia ocellicauda TaxID=2972642 RepID=UPI003463C09E
MQLILFMATFLTKVSSAPVPVSVSLGESVSLTCDGSAAAEIPEEKLHILWKMPGHEVLVLSSGSLFPGPGFEGRAEVPTEKIRQGDFSLTIHRTLLSDEGLYECLYEGANDEMKFLGDVYLAVTARQDFLTLRSGANLSFPLHSSAPVQVLFAAAGSAKSPRVLLNSSGLPGPGYEHRVSVQSGFLTLRSLTAADQGNYTVRDCSTGRTVSTVSVSVEAHRDSLTLRSGAALSLPLFTAEPVEVLFAAAGEGASVSVCAVERGAASRPGPGYEHRVSVQSGSLTLRSLTAADQGNYTVRDCSTGRTVSTVSVSVSVADPPQDSTAAIAVSVSLALVLLLAGAAGVVWWKWRGSGGRRTETPGHNDPCSHADAPEPQSVELQHGEKHTDTAQPLLNGLNAQPQENGRGPHPPAPSLCCL